MWEDFEIARRILRRKKKNVGVKLSQTFPALIMKRNAGYKKLERLQLLSEYIDLTTSWTNLQNWSEIMMVVIFNA